jgi:hypothetical protein
MTKAQLEQQVKILTKDRQDLTSKLTFCANEYAEVFKKNETHIKNAHSLEVRLLSLNNEIAVLKKRENELNIIITDKVITNIRLENRLNNALEELDIERAKPWYKKVLGR